MQDPELTAEEQQAIDSVYNFAAQLVGDGHSKQQVADALMQEGVDSEAAHAVARNIWQMKKSAVRKAGLKHVVIGGLWFVGGLAVTIGTMAASDGGGFVVAYGAVIIGGLQMLYGFFKMATG